MDHDAQAHSGSAQTDPRGASAHVQVGQPKRDSTRSRFALSGASQPFDARTVAIRPDLADIAVAGTHFAPHYAAPMARSCIVPRAALRKAAAADAEQVSELLYGEGFALLDVTGGWAWGYMLADHYVGYVEASALGGPIAPTHRVVAAGATLTSRDGPARTLPGGALVMGTVAHDHLDTAAGTIPLDAVRPVDDVSADPVDTALALLGTPYLWGGRSPMGIDCSGLMQYALGLAGTALPRDSDMQRASMPGDQPVDAPLRRGDVVFFPHHVGMMVDATTMVHASQHWQKVATEPLADVVARTEAKGHVPAIIAVKRLSAA